MEANQQDVEEHAERPEVDLRKIPRKVAPGSEKVPARPQLDLKAVRLLRLLTPRMP